MNDKNIFSKYIKETNNIEEIENNEFDEMDRILEAEINGDLSITSTSKSTTKKINTDFKTDLNNILTEKKAEKNLIPDYIIPWRDNITYMKQYTGKLINAGYINVRLIATASVDEMSENTGIPIHLCDKLIKNAQQWFNFNFDTAMNLLVDRNDMERISTGCDGLDSLFEGGIEPKSITEFFGEFISGKTQICLQLSVNTALPKSKGGHDAYVVYIDTEGSFRPERIIQMIKKYNVDSDSILSKILVARAYNSDIQMRLVNNVIQLASNYNIKLLIIDSISANFRAEFIGNESLIERQQKLNKHVQQLNRIADVLNIAVVITNQVLSSMITGEKIPVGGNILAHGVTHRVKCTNPKTESGFRIAKLIASPSYPVKTVNYKITENGVEDA